MRFLNFMLPLLACSALASGCIVSEADDDGAGGGGGEIGGGGSGAAGGSGGSGGSGGAGMTCYEPTPASGSEAFNWMMPNEEDVTTIATPADPGGGVLRIKLTANNGELIPWVTVLNTNDPEGSAVLGGSSATTANEQEWNGAFIAAGGQTYELTMYPFFNAPAGAYPVDYTLDWTFEPLQDCYEPNDTFAEAAAIARGDVIDAYLTGLFYTSDPGEEVDHYTVQVDEPGMLTFQALSLPSSTAGLAVRNFRADADFPNGYAQNGASATLAAGESHTWEVAEAGTYLFEVKPEVGLLMTVSQDNPEPGHFSEGYSFRVD